MKTQFLSSSVALAADFPSSIPIRAVNLSPSLLSNNENVKNIFDPNQFVPVCPTSDVFYQILKGTINNIVGNDNIIEYGPLIASVLLRLRLELCVLESFLYEAIIPFIQKKGLTWVLPIHETLETFVAGAFFALATNFILLGSSKIFNIILVYIDALTGFPANNLGKIKKYKNIQ